MDSIECQEIRKTKYGTACLAKAPASILPRAISLTREDAEVPDSDLYKIIKHVWKGDLPILSSALVVNADCGRLEEKRLLLDVECRDAYKIDVKGAMSSVIILSDNYIEAAHDIVLYLLNAGHHHVLDASVLKAFEGIGLDHNEFIKELASYKEPQDSRNPSFLEPPADWPVVVAPRVRTDLREDGALQAEEPDVVDVRATPELSLDAICRALAADKELFDVVKNIYSKFQEKREATIELVKKMLA